MDDDLTTVEPFLNLLYVRTMPRKMIFSETKKLVDARAKKAKEVRLGIDISFDPGSHR